MQTHQYALENVMDPMHGTYLHSSSHSMAEGDRKADMVLQPTKTGFIFEKKGQSGVNFDWLELGNSGALPDASVYSVQSVSAGGQF